MHGTREPTPRSPAQDMEPSALVRELAATVPGATTDDLLHNLLDKLTGLLRARRGYVSVVSDDGISRTIASWEDGRRGPARQYEVAGTPCASVIRDGVQVVQCDLGRRFLMEQGSLGYGCESFVGCPIYDRGGTKIGLLCVFGAVVLEDPQMASALISLAAARVSAELEYREHEASLQRERRKLEVLLGNLPGMAYRFDTDEQHRIRYVSEGAKQLTGYGSDELVEVVRQWTDLVLEEDRDLVRKEIRSALREGRSYDVQYRIVTADGSPAWVWDRGCGVADDGDARTFQEGFISDITELKDYEAALARSEAYSTTIISSAAEGIITLDATGRIESVNQAAEKMFGYEAGELIGRDINVLIPEPYRRRHAAHIEHYVTTGERSIFGAPREVPAQRRDGTIFPVHLAASEILLDGERSFAGIIRDISEQKAAESSLKAAERRYKAVFDQRHQLSSLLNSDGVLLEANQRSLDFAGVQRDAVVGLAYWEVPWWRHSPGLQQRIRRAVEAAAGGATVRFDATCTRADGQQAILDFSVRPIMDSGGNLLFLVTESQDITEQRRAEEEAREHRARIAHVSRLSTLGEMAAGIAHEINQPLSAISLFAQAGKRLVEAGDYEKLRAVCEKLSEHALRASDVVERMRVMARQGEGSRELLDCNDLIDSAVKLAEADSHIHDVPILFERGGRLPPVLVDGVQIQQVALNLLRNAMEATVAARDEDEKWIAVRTSCREDGSIEVAVRDNGEGVPDEHVEGLFMPFSTSKESGMGMGLSISRAIVRAHGGDIDFRNDERGGATFWFTLPAATIEAQDG